MGNRLKRYLKYIDECSKRELESDEREKIVQDLLIQISFFQHERLIHLIVTVTFALLTLMSLFASILVESFALLLLLGLFIVLLIPYILHYYKLENGVQKLYEYYDILNQNEKKR